LQACRVWPCHPCRLLLLLLGQPLLVVLSQLLQVVLLLRLQPAGCRLRLRA
jgi:hypothetical protein